MRRRRRLAAAALTFGIACAAATADPYLWLEEVEGARALEWVRAQNEKTARSVAATPEFAALQADILAILDSDAKIPRVEKIGDRYYNLWTDARHERGLFRRTTLEEYRQSRPRWETVLDVDALNAAEKENWVWRGIECLPPEHRRCLIALSRGGADATVTREFDLVAKRWVREGFSRPESKGELGWIDANTVHVATDFGPGTMTTSGYPRIVKRWRRGTPLASATTVYEGRPTDMSISASHDPTPGFERDFVKRWVSFYADELYFVGKKGELIKIDVPDSAEKRVHREWLTLQLRDPWSVGGKTYGAGSLLATRLDAFMAGERHFEVLFAPSASVSLVSATWTRNHLVLEILDDVKSRIRVLDSASQWKESTFAGLPDAGWITASAVDERDSDAVWITTTDFLTPTALAIAEGGRVPQALKSSPAFFDASTHVTEQFFASSEDGTRIPYFVVRPRKLAFDGKARTLLDAYGGFEVSLLPWYSGPIGKAWLEKGGVYVLANIRGGGEYGPRWHQAALKANRRKAFEDLAAVARDLVARRITSVEHLGMMGASNGGLLAGNMLTQYPQSFGAIAIQVPLLDMQRYSHLLAGASWMAEYGDPDDPREWQFIRTFSPYHLFDATRTYPPVLFTTSTRDDRVHPGHARKMAAMMIDAGKDVTYFENTEGGHGGAASNKQSAYMDALTYLFLWERLE